MKVLIGQHITFETEVNNRPNFATVHGDYKIVEMSEEEFEKWADETNSDWISEDYDGEIYFNEYKSKEEIFA